MKKCPEPVPGAGDGRRLDFFLYDAHGGASHGLHVAFDCLELILASFTKQKMFFYTCEFVAGHQVHGVGFEPLLLNMFTSISLHCWYLSSHSLGSIPLPV